MYVKLFVAKSLVVLYAQRIIEPKTPHFTWVLENVFFWLGFGYGNITFEDSLDFDISEIDSVYEDEEQR